MKQRDREGRPEASVAVHLHLHPAFHIVSERTNKNRLLGVNKNKYFFFALTPCEKYNFEKQIFGTE